MVITSEFAARIRAESYIDCRGYRYFVIDEQGFKKFGLCLRAVLLLGQHVTKRIG